VITLIEKEQELQVLILKGHTQIIVNFLTAIHP